jgi:hypothetical protein
MKYDKRGYPVDPLKAVSNDPHVGGWYYVGGQNVEVHVRSLIAWGTHNAVVKLPTRTLRAILKRSERARRAKR